jgi:short-subunit dehydrogenase
MKGCHLILGATSGLGKALSREMAAEGAGLILAGRSAPDLAMLAADIEARTARRPGVLPFDARQPDCEHLLLTESTRLNSGHPPAGVVLCFGVMFAQLETERDPALLEELVTVNYLSSIRILQAFANRFEERGDGLIVGIGSVAGDRGRAANFHYGSTKAALGVFLDGLRLRLHGTGVRVCHVKPGFMATPMTYGLVDPHSPLCASPEKAARDVLRAMKKGRGLVYTKGVWRYIMAFLRLLPEPLFRQLKR